MTAQQAQEEAQFRKVEGAMLHVEDAARCLAEAAAELKRDEAPAYLVAALETAADAVRADHKRLMKSVYWPAAADAGQALTSPPESAQQRLIEEKSLETVRVIYHHEAEGWWAESPDVEGWSAAGDDFREVRSLVVEGIPVALGRDVELEHYVPAGERVAA